MKLKRTFNISYLKYIYVCTVYKLTISNTEQGTEKDNTTPINTLFTVHNNTVQKDCNINKHYNETLHFLNMYSE